MSKKVRRVVLFTRWQCISPLPAYFACAGFTSRQFVKCLPQNNNITYNIIYIYMYHNIIYYTTLNKSKCYQCQPDRMVPDI